MTEKNLQKYGPTLMAIAELYAKHSTCNKLQVGAVIADDDGTPLADGYNGTVFGSPSNNCEDNFIHCSRCNTDFKPDEVEMSSSESAEHRARNYMVECPKCFNTESVQLSYTEILQSEAGKNSLILEKAISKFKVIKPVQRTSEYVVHAEQNAITACARKGISTQGKTIFITHSPCKSCAKLIVQAGIKIVVYETPYRDKEGINFLEQVGVKVVKLPEITK